MVVGCCMQGFTELKIVPSRSLSVVRLHCRQMHVSNVLINGKETSFLHDNFLDQPDDPLCEPQGQYLLKYQCATRAAHEASDEGELSINIDASTLTEVRKGKKKKKKEDHDHTMAVVVKEEQEIKVLTVGTTMTFQRTKQNRILSFDHPSVLSSAQTKGRGCVYPGSHHTTLCPIIASHSSAYVHRWVTSERAMLVSVHQRRPDKVSFRGRNHHICAQCCRLHRRSRVKGLISFLFSLLFVLNVSNNGEKKRATDRRSFMMLRELSSHTTLRNRIKSVQTVWDSLLDLLLSFLMTKTFLQPFVSPIPSKTSPPSPL